jgi:MFS transporter, DHA3 family, macrolide efflux protein
MKNRRGILLLFIANFISGIAQGIAMIAIPWYFAKAGAMSLFGMIYFSSNALSLVWSPFSGTLIDKYDRKHIFLSICLVMGLLEGFILLTGKMVFNGVGLWGVGAIFVLTSLNYNIHYNNLYAFSQEIIEAQYIKKLSSYLEVSNQVAAMLAGGAAAFLLDGTSQNAWITIKAWTIEEIFFYDMITYFLAFLILYNIDYERFIIKKGKEDGGFIVRLRAGLAYLKRDMKLFWFGLLSLSIFATLMVFEFMGAAMYVKSVLKRGGDIFAMVDLFYGFGAAMAGVGIQRIFAKIELQNSVIFLTFLTACCYAMMYSFPNAQLFLFLMFLIGITNAGARIQRVNYIFQHIDNQYFGRVNSVFSFLNILTRMCFIALISTPFFLNEYMVRILIVFVVFLLGACFFMKKNQLKVGQPFPL